MPFRRLSKIDRKNRELAHKNPNSLAPLPLKKRPIRPINLLNVVTGPPLDGRSAHKGGPKTGRWLLNSQEILNMALTLNTNIDSLTAQNNLSGSQSLLSQSLTRLSSGLRINSASDDAAGLAIAQQFTTQVNGTNQAINNANDAVSEAQTAAGALTTIVNNLQSIRTLAVEAANGSNSTSDRAALDSQVQQQIAEITQIASQTTFNGANVLNGSAGTTVYQVGANVGNTISVNLSTGVEASQIGQMRTSRVR